MLDSVNYSVTFVLLIFLTSQPCSVHNANIVFYFGVSSYSHRVPAWPLAIALGEGGHNVTFISPFPAKNPHPKVRDYVPVKLKEWADSWGEIENVFEDRKNNAQANGWLMLPEFGKMACDVIFSDTEMVSWIKESQVDLVFIDSLFNECGYGFAAHWNAKIIAFSTTTVVSWFTESYGLPDETNWIPSMELFYPPSMTFMQRMKNALIPVVWSLQRRWSYFPYLEQISRDSLNLSQSLSFEEIEHNIPLVFANTHYSEEFARSLPPNVVAVGGIGMVEKKTPLPNDLEAFLRKGSHFIYVSFGTYADFNLMHESTQNAFIGAMKRFPDLQFVWKVDNDTVINEFPANNVFIKKWMPQQDILAHPKIKGFITHSGLLGTQEAIYNAVPLISFPIFAEQDYNAERIDRKKFGIRLEITNVTQAELEDAISKILNDPVYKENAVTVSALFKERPQKPLDTALWWTDFVLRHSPQDLKSLRPLSVGQSWWKKRQLDVWLTLAAALTAISILLLYTSIKVLKYFCSNTGKSQSSKKKHE